MVHGSDVPSRADAYRNTARVIADFYSDHEDVIRGLAGLRRLADGRQAAEAVMRVAAVRTLHLSLALFEALAESEGLDPIELLDAVTLSETIDVMRAAFEHDSSPGRTLELLDGGAS